MKKKEPTFEELIQGLKNPERWLKPLMKFDRLYANSERRDRYHKTLSSDYIYFDDNGTQVTLLDLIPTPDLNPEELLIRKEDAKQIDKVLKTFDKTDIYILVGYFVCSKKLKTIASELNISPAAVSKRKMKSLNKLKDLLSAYYADQLD